MKITHCNQTWKRSKKKHTELLEQDLIQGLQQEGLGHEQQVSLRDHEDSAAMKNSQSSIIRAFTYIFYSFIYLVFHWIRRKRNLTYSTSESAKVDLARLQQHQKTTKKTIDDAECTIHVWDFAGDLQFYNLHQIFLRPKCVYTFIVNLSRNLHDYIQAHQMPYHGTHVKMKYHQQIEFWLNMIASHSLVKNNENYKGNVVIVGTHKDLLPGDPEQQLIYTT